MNFFHIKKNIFTFFLCIIIIYIKIDNFSYYYYEINDTMINMDKNLLKKLPLEIIINHILPFTYCIQSTLLLEDIKNFVTSKEILFDIFRENKKLFNDNNIFIPFIEENETISIIMYLLNYIFHIRYIGSNYSNFKIYELNVKKLMINFPNLILNKIWKSLNIDERNQFIIIRNFQFNCIKKKLSIFN